MMYLSTVNLYRQRRHLLRQGFHYNKYLIALP